MATPLESILRHAFYRDERNTTLPSEPLPPPTLPAEYEATAHGHERDLERFSLTTDDDWEKFHDLFAGSRGDNTKPWFRCLSVLRGHKVKSAILERHYVCLDYRSEFASFYAHLDAPRRSFTIRLHFFRRELDGVDLFNLEDDIKNSYVGYMVLREGDLPLVGRSVITPPAYVTVSTAVLEPVNFFGQRLEVRGVPFMQQDQRFASCAHVSAWVAHYSAFRRGIFERRLVADFVNLASGFTPMRPRHVGGLTVNELTKLLDEVGFRALAIFMPGNMEGVFPPISAAELPEVLQFLPEGLHPFPDSGDNPESVLSLEWLNLEIAEVAEAAFDQFANREAHGPRPDHHPSTSQSPHAAPEVQAVERILNYMIGPLVESGWPVYADTGDHAVTICGRATLGANFAYVVHDDQSGPYLLAPSLTYLSSVALQRQSGRYRDLTSEEQMPYPPVDLLDQDPAQIFTIDSTPDLSIDALVVPLPPRVLVHPPQAKRRALLTLARFLDAKELWEGVATEIVSELGRGLTRTTLLMGIDYKAMRRASAKERDDADGLAFFSTQHLAEWVMLVEGLAADGNSCLWEFVFDASSNPDQPRLQVGRVLDIVLGVNPKGGAPGSSTRLSVQRLPLVERPQTFRKWSSATPPELR